jgi:hypothetical protein
MYYLYHTEGTQKQYYKYALTSDDIANGYVQLPENFIGAIEIFPIGDALQTNNIFSIRYQIALNDLYTLTSVSMVPYYMALSHLEFLEQMLVGLQPIRYNRVDNKFYMDMNYDFWFPGNFIVIVAYGVIDPETYSRAWMEPWLFKYTKALVKQNFGQNLSKYIGVKLIGGTEFNGQKILDDATAEIEKLEVELIDKWSAPLGYFIG